MPRYTDRFKLTPEDLEMIEEALRAQVARPSDDIGPCPREVQQLLGRLHTQKVFYSTARADGTPNG